MKKKTTGLRARLELQRVLTTRPRQLCGRLTVPIQLVAWVWSRDPDSSRELCAHPRSGYHSIAWQTVHGDNDNGPRADDKHAKLLLRRRSMYTSVATPPLPDRWFGAPGVLKTARWTIYEATCTYAHTYTHVLETGESVGAVGRRRGRQSC